MIEPSNTIKAKLLFILHRGLVEVRLLTAANKTQQIFDLADALEPIPAMMKDWHENDLSKVRSLLVQYQSKYVGCGFDFVSRLETDPPPSF